MKLVIIITQNSNLLTEFKNILNNALYITLKMTWSHATMAFS